MNNYTDCKNNDTVVFCDRYLWSECPDTCLYCLEMEGLGIGSSDPETQSRLEKQVNEDKHNTNI